MIGSGSTLPRRPTKRKAASLTEGVVNASDESGSSLAAAVPRRRSRLSEATNRRRVSFGGASALAAPAPADALSDPSAGAGRRIDTSHFGVMLGEVLGDSSGGGRTGTDSCTSPERVELLDLRPSDSGKYYPTSSRARQRGEEYAKKWPGDAGELSGASFCACTDGCVSACPCAAEGIGCWWEDWGCGCAGACAVAGTHVYDELAVHKARQKALRRRRL